MVGSGSATTLITCSTTWGITYIPTSDAAFEISGFGFTFTPRIVTRAFLYFQGNAAYSLTGIKVHDNTFTNGYYAIYFYGLEAGVVYSNQFTDNYIAVYSGGVEKAGWDWAIGQGNAANGGNFPFIEGNTFTDTGTVATDGFIAEAGHGGRFVFRYNTITNRQDGTGSGGEVFDTHGVNGTYNVNTNRGTVASEIYNNTINFADHGHRLINHRGGKMIAFNNTVTGSYGATFNISEYQGWSYCTADAYPKPDQINSSYYYSNTTLGSALVPTLLCASGVCSSCAPSQYDGDYLTENTDYTLSAKGGYTPYECPHPLVDPTNAKTCDGTAGLAGYNLDAADVTAPVVTAFVIPATADSLTVAVTTFTATDAIGVTGYCLTETNDSATCSWTGTAPATFPFGTAGAKTLYAFARDAAGNISTNTTTDEVDTDGVTITIASGAAVRSSGSNAVYGAGNNAVR